MGARLFVAIACVCALACDETLVQPTESLPLSVTRLGRADSSLTYSSGFTTSQRLVVRDATTWGNTWAAIWGRVSTPPPLPEIDFTREMVIVAALGQRNTGGYSIFVAEAAEENGTVRVRIRSVSPGPRCGVTLALTEPVDAARVARRDGVVTFEETAEVQQCP